MAAATRIPLPPFPRWTGMHLTLGPPRQHGLTLTADLHVPTITRRARLWWTWRTLTRKGVPDAAPHQ